MNTGYLRVQEPGAERNRFGLGADDLDGDGNPNIWLGGNFYSLKPQVGRHNASRRVFLKGGLNFLYLSTTAT
jgi:hypothetical protein